MSPSDFTDALDSDSSATATSPVGRFTRGCRLGIPIFLGYAPVGMAFGVLALAGGFTPVGAVMCSATALAGAGQFIALALLTGGANAISALMATTVVNLRYVLFATTLAPDVREVRLPELAWLGFTLTDETFAVNITDLRQGKATPASMGGVGLIAWVGWVAGTAVGAYAAGALGDPTRFGVDFAMPAMFSALFVALAEDSRHVVVGALAGAVALVLPALSAVGLPIDASWVVVISSCAAATVASAVYRR